MRFPLPDPLEAAPASLLSPTRSVSGLVAALLCWVSASSASASGFGLFQHGGRGAGQAGAFVARADSPAALSVNPAGLVTVAEPTLEAGLDFGAPRDEYREDGLGDFAAKHQINLTPAAYFAWRPSAASDWAFGVGLDSPFWTTVDWLPTAFPLAFQAKRYELRLLEVHPAAAWAIDEHWSVGAGIRYLSGNLRERQRILLAAGRDPGTYFTRGERSWEADVDGLGVDAGVRFAAAAWGFGASLRSPVRVEGGSAVDVTVIDVVRPQDQDRVALRIAEERGRPGEQFFELPLELRAGVWVAPFPGLRVELDLAFQAWSSTENETPQTLACLAVSFCGFERRDWRDTVSVRLGIESDLGENVLLFGGLAWEPSPVRAGTVEPGFPRGDAWVGALGASYEFPQIVFDLGYSLHLHEAVEPAFSSARFEATEQVFSVSVRRRF